MNYLAYKKWERQNKIYLTACEIIFKKEGTVTDKRKEQIFELCQDLCTELMRVLNDDFYYSKDWKYMTISVEDGTNNVTR